MHKVTQSVVSRRNWSIPLMCIVCASSALAACSSSTQPDPGTTADAMSTDSNDLPDGQAMRSDVQASDIADAPMDVDLSDAVPPCPLPNSICCCNVNGNKASAICSAGQTTCPGGFASHNWQVCYAGADSGITCGGECQPPCPSDASDAADGADSATDVSDVTPDAVSDVAADAVQDVDVDAVAFDTAPDSSLSDALVDAVGADATSDVGLSDAVTETGGGDADADAADSDGSGYDSLAVDTSGVVVTNFVQAVQMASAGTMETGAVSAALIQPTTCTSSAFATCPLVIVVADHGQVALPDLLEPAKELAAVMELNVLVFNLPGTGLGGNQSTGTNDIGGPWHTEALRQLVISQSKVKGVDAKKVGFLTIGTGLIAVAGAYYLYPSSLAATLFVVDVEGPVDRCSITQAPEDVTLGVGPGDGPGVTDASCHFTSIPEATQYPVPQNGQPASVLCSAGAWPISESGEDCTSAAWWINREPYAHLQKVPARYLRLQFKYDHALPSHSASRLAMKSLGLSPSPYIQLNDMPACSGISDADCATLEAAGSSCWIKGPWGNGLPGASYIGKDYQAVSWHSLFAEVLPVYLYRAIDTKNYPKCQ